MVLTLLAIAFSLSGPAPGAQVAASGDAGLTVRKVALEAGQHYRLGDPAPAGADLLPTTDSYEPVLPVFRDVLLSDASIECVATFEDYGFSAYIHLDKAGREIFAATTAENLDKRFALVVDGLVISAPAIASVIPDGQLQINGGSREQAEELVAAIRAGVRREIPTCVFEDEPDA